MLVANRRQGLIHFSLGMLFLDGSLLQLGPCPPQQTHLIPVQGLGICRRLICPEWISASARAIKSDGWQPPGRVGLRKSA